MGCSVSDVSGGGGLICGRSSSRRFCERLPAYCLGQFRQPLGGCVGIGTEQWSGWPRKLAGRNSIELLAVSCWRGSWLICGGNRQVAWHRAGPQRCLAKKVACHNK